MKLFKQLSAAIEREHQQGELPDYLIAPLQQVAENSDQFSGQLELVEKLLTQLNDFDPYSDCGCFGEGYTSQHVMSTLQQLGIEVDGVTSSSCSL